MLRTNIPEQVRQSLNEEAVSVIHAPESFQSWVSKTIPVGTVVSNHLLKASSDSTIEPSEEPPRKLSPKSSPKLNDIKVPSRLDHASKVYNCGLLILAIFLTNSRPVLLACLPLRLYLPI